MLFARAWTFQVRDAISEIQSHIEEIACRMTVEGTSSYFLLMRASLNLYSVGSTVSTRVLPSRSRQYTLLPFTIVM